MRQINLTQSESRSRSINMSEKFSLKWIDAKIAEKMLKENDGTFSCLLCGKSGVKHKGDMKKHVETHLEGLSFPCQHCGKTFRSRNALHIHNTRQHKLWRENLSRYWLFYVSGPEILCSNTNLFTDVYYFQIRYVTK